MGLLLKPTEFTGEFVAPPPRPWPDWYHRFFASVYRFSRDQRACWIWTGAFDSDGYGTFTYRGRTYKAHRFSLEQFLGAPIPAGLIVLHRCDNPPCVNPLHLNLGTNEDNVADRDRKGRVQHGNHHSKAKVTSADVIEIRQSNEPCRALATKFGINIMTVYAIRSRKTWRRI